MNPTRSRSIACVADRLRPEPVRAPTGSRPRRSAPAPAGPPAAPPGRGPSGYPTAACHHLVSGSPRAWLARDGTGPRAGHGTTRAACGPPRSPPPAPGSAGPPRPRPGWPGPAPTPPTGRHPCRHGRTGRGNAVPQTAWPQPIACVGVVARSPVRPRRLDGRPAGVVGPGGPGHALTLTPAASVIKVGALPSRRVMLTPISGTTTPSDSRCPPLGLHHRLIPRVFAGRRPAQTGLSCSTPDRDHVPLPVPRRDPQADPGTGPGGHGLRRDMSGSAPPL